MGQNEDWMAEVQRGSETAFEDLYAANAPPLLRFIQSRVRDPASADAVANRVWLNVWQRSRTFQLNAEFRRWVFTIAYHETVSHQRQQPRERSGFGGEEADESGSQYEPEDPAPTPVELAIATELRQKIDECLSQLPEHLRSVIALRSLEGWKYREIAEILQTPIPTLKHREMKALRLLRECLGISGVRPEEY